MNARPRVALINVRIESRQRIPMGPLYLAACIKGACDVVIFDPEPDQSDFSDVVGFRPDVVGLGFMTQTRFRAKQIYEVLRPALPGAKFVLGGVGPTVEPDLTFESFRPDALVVGEGEKTFQRIVAGEPPENIPGVFFPDRPFVPPEIYEDLDEVPLPAYECMPDFTTYLCPPGGIRGTWFKRGSPIIMSGRGCPYNCTFCSTRLMFGRRVRRRSVGSVMEEIRHLHHQYGVEAVYFYDDTFNVQRPWVEEFCDTLLSEPYRLTWACQIRVNLFDPELGRVMKKAGCIQADVGVESGSPRVLEAINKNETVEQIEQAFAACHQVGIRPMGNFLVGCPDETWEDVEQTKALVRRIKPAFSEFFFLTPYPGSDLHKQAVENGWFIDQSYEGRGMIDRPVMEINFTAEEQIRIRNGYYRLVAWRNLRGYLSLSVLAAMLLSVRFCMIRAFLCELVKTRNFRDAMQAYVHALRRWHCRSGKRTPAD